MLIKLDLILFVFNLIFLKDLYGFPGNVAHLNDLIRG